MKGWKTLIFGALITLLGGIQLADIAVIVPEQYQGIVMSVIGVIVMFLRTITRTPIGKSNPTA